MPDMPWPAYLRSGRRTPPPYFLVFAVSQLAPEPESHVAQHRGRSSACCYAPESTRCPAHVNRETWMVALCYFSIGEVLASGAAQTSLQVGGARSRLGCASGLS